MATQDQIEELKAKGRRIAKEGKSTYLRVESAKKAFHLMVAIMQYFVPKANTIWERKCGNEILELHNKLPDYVGVKYDPESKQVFVNMVGEMEDGVNPEMLYKKSKLIPKSIQKEFEKQGDTSHLKMEEIPVICKLIAPGIGVWYLYEEVEEGIYMSVAHLVEAEIGTVSLQQLLSIPNIERVKGYKIGGETVKDALEREQKRIAV